MTGLEASFTAQPTQLNIANLHQNDTEDTKSSILQGRDYDIESQPRSLVHITHALPTYINNEELSEASEEFKHKRISVEEKLSAKTKERNELVKKLLGGLSVLYSHAGVTAGAA